MKIFDFHTHAFVETLAERAMASLEASSDIQPFTDGTVGGLKKIMRKNAVFGALLLPIATKPTQQHTINNWAADVMDDKIYCCGTVHPDAPDALDEVERIKNLGLYGIKFHSEYQKFYPDEEKMLPIYEKIADSGLFTVFHGGWDPISEAEVRATPERFAKIIKNFPKLTFVIAHLGGMNLWNDVEKFIAGKFENVYLDVSVIAGYVDPKQLLRIIKAQGSDKILFGSDCPWSDPASEIEMINLLELSDDEKANIFYKNAEKLLRRNA